MIGLRVVVVVLVPPKIWEIQSLMMPFSFCSIGTGATKLARPITNKKKTRFIVTVGRN